MAISDFYLDIKEYLRAKLQAPDIIWLESAMWGGGGGGGGGKMTDINFLATISTESLFRLNLAPRLYNFFHAQLN